MLNTLLKYSWDDFDTDVVKIINYIERSKQKITAIYAFPRGGLILGVTLSNILKIPLYLTLEEALEKHNEADICICDDISDSGETFNSVFEIENHFTVSLCMKPKTSFIPNFFCKTVDNDTWIVFPWENHDKINCERDGTLSE